MSRDRSGDLQTAAELMAELENDPDHRAKIEQKERARQQRNAFNRKSSAPVVEALRRAGFEVDSVADLFGHKMNYRSAVPILLEWLPKVDNPAVKEDIVRALTVKWARPDAAKALLREFKAAPQSEDTALRWAVANALETVADDSVFDEIAALASNQYYGKSREMLALSLGNMADPRAVTVLLDLLNDGEVAGHAVMGLGRLKAKKAKPKIRPFLEHPKPWVRKEAKKALAKIDQK